MDQIETETRMQIQERLRAAQGFTVLLGENQRLRVENKFLGLCNKGFTVRSLDNYAAKIEAMKDDAWRRDMRRVRRIRVFSKVRDYEAAMWIGGATVACLSFFYWLALR